MNHSDYVSTSQYPPPPVPDNQHYNPAPYPPVAASHDAGQSGPYVAAEQFSQTSIPYASSVKADHEPLGSTTQIYPKTEHVGLDPTTSSAIEQRIEQLQHQQSLEREQSLGEQPHQVTQSTESDPHEDKNAANKLLRLRKACDSCSVRKVKCDEAGPPCRACASLDIPCTFERPSRRRGPPNRHAEMIKRRRLEGDQSTTPAMSTSPTHAAEALASLSSHSSAPSGLSAESILPFEIIDLLIKDYFTYIHPLNPFPHKPSFLDAWKFREDYTNRPFLALLASMIAALVSSFPRKPRQHLKAHGREKMFKTHVDLVHTCFKVCAEARGPGYLETKSLTVHHAATSYLLGMAATFIFEWRTGRLYHGECLTIIKALGLDKAKDNTYVPPAGVPQLYGSGGPDQDGSKEQILDNITLQVGRRVFWTLFVASRSLAQLGAGWGELYIPPSNATEPYPPLPLEVEDDCIYPDRIEPQPHGLISIITGFNANVRIFLSYQPITNMEMMWGVNKVVDWESQKHWYHDCLIHAKSIVATLPEELKLCVDYDDNTSNDSRSLAAFRIKMGMRGPSSFRADPSQQTEGQTRSMQQEIQKANIYATEVATRSYIVEKYWTAYELHNARGASPAASRHAVVMGLDAVNPLSANLVNGRNYSHHRPPSVSSQTGDIEMQAEMSAERENVLRSLLTVLSTIEKVNMEPNGDSFAHKIRFVASTLVNLPEERKGQFALEVEQYLASFVDILVKLERTKASHMDDVDEQDERNEGHWNDLKEYQARFVQDGAVHGNGRPVVRPGV